MLARRGRLHQKPNLAKCNIRQSEKNSNEAGCTAKVGKPVSVGTDVETRNFDNLQLVVSSPSCEASKSNPNPEEVSESRAESCVSPVASEIEQGVSVASSSRRIAHSPRSVASHRSSTCETSIKHPRKRLFVNEKLDTKKMRMMDMVYWNPKDEKGISKRCSKDSISLAEDSPEKNEVSPTKTVAPQVKIDLNGKLILDEASLVVPETQSDASLWETVEEDRASRKVTSLSFRNRLWRKGTPWTEKETNLFFEVLRCTGPDFGLMHEFFPSRARNELKNKYNREERLHWDKVKQTLSAPALLDDTLYDRVSVMEREIEEEAKLKKQKKVGSKKIAGKVATEWDEETADLIGEAEGIIRELEREWGTRGRSPCSGDESSCSSDIVVTRKAKAKKKKLSKTAQLILDASRAHVKGNSINREEEEELSGQGQARKKRRARL